MMEDCKSKVIMVAYYEIRDCIQGILKDYTCKYSATDMMDPMPLLDKLSPAEDVTITRGKLELKALAEYIANELFERL
ncbi:MAG: hypothetical protein KKD44_29200 [Proteobacteria bacterium]|nr:hypothetical protein [Pseudomonadota bacterium]